MAQKKQRKPTGIKVETAKPRAKALKKSGEVSASPIALPMAEPRPIKWYVAFILAAAIFSVGAYLANDNRVGGWEYSLFIAINGWAEGWYRLFTIVTFFGSTFMAVLSVGTLYLLGAYRMALRLAFTIFGVYGVTFLAKYGIHRSRPAEIFSEAHERFAEVGMGYPSLHTAIVTATLLTLLPYLPKTTRWFIIVIVISLIGLSRIYLGVHLPLDILGGAAIGIAVVAFMHLMPKRWQRLMRIN